MQWLAVLVDVYNVYFSLTYTDTVYVCLLTDACMCFYERWRKTIHCFHPCTRASTFCERVWPYMLSVLALNNTKQVKHT